MVKRRLGFLVLAVMVVSALVPALLAPSQAEASRTDLGWFVYTPNHPNGCAPLPWDCYVIQIMAETP